MSTLKTKVGEEQVIAFLQKTFDPNISSLTFLKGGEMSQAFAFEMDSLKFVIRVNKKDYSFRKDAYAYQHFQNPKIPMPKIIKVGKFNDALYFAISEKVEGQNFDTLPLETQRKLIPQLIEIQDAIHKTKIPDGKYGYWDNRGIAKSKSMQEFVLYYEDDTYSQWENLYKNTYLERKIVEDTYVKLRELVSFLPEERFLIHGDFGGQNAISDGKRIKGILDWGESAYGDFLYDVAWVELYQPELGYSTACRVHYEKMKLDVPNYDERILCYELRTGIGGLGFFARSKQKKNYLIQKEKIETLLSM